MVQDQPIIPTKKKNFYDPEYEKKACKNSDGYRDLKKLRFVLDHDQNVAYCQVPKCGSTSWSVAFAEANKMDNYKEYLNAGIMQEKLMEKYSIGAKELKSGTFIFTFVRHPCQRIASAYAEKIIKRKAPTFVQPILQWERKQNIVITDSHEADISFERFVNFIVFEVEFNIITHGSLHWWPYTNLCHLCHIHHDFIGKLETLATDIETLSNNDRFANFNLST